jgi:hypothetical protein
VTSTTVEVATRDGRPVLIKRAVDERGHERLDREVDRLRMVTHPGVVELLDVVGRPPDEIVLAWAGDRTLETARPALPAAVALLASLAGTVADLHELGITHGRIEPMHVVVDSHGRPRLCGLRGADPDEEPGEAADDVAALGRLIEMLVGDVTEAEPIPERRWGRRRWTGFQRRSLLTLADQATDPDPQRRPSARALARSIGEAVPDARFDPIEPPPPPPAEPVDAPAPPPVAEPADAVPLAPRTFLGMRLVEPDAVDMEEAAKRSTSSEPPRSIEDPPAAGPQRSALVRAGVGLVAIACAGAALVAIGARARPTSARVADAPSTSTTVSAPGPVGTSTSTLPMTNCPSVGAPRADVDHDGCPETVRVTGNVIVAGAARFEIGVRGDLVSIGDWDCDGSATPAIVRPSTGDVFVFRSWAAPDDRITLQPTTNVPGAVGPVDVRPARCGPLVVRQRSGATAEIPSTKRRKP